MYRFIFVLFAMLWFIPTAAAQQPADEVARLRVGHFSFNISIVDVYVNGDLAVEDFEYPDMSNWLALTPGPTQIAITPADTPLENAVLGPVQLSLEAEEWYTAAVIGRAETNGARIHILQEDFSAIPAGIARITVFNAVPDNRPLSFFTDDDRRVFGLTFPRPGSEQDGAFTIDIAAQTYDLRLTRTDNEGAAFFSLDNTTLGSNRHYFIAAIGSGIRANGIFVTTNLEDFVPPGETTAADPDNTSASETEEAPTGQTHLRVGHFASQTAALDLYLNGQLTDIQGAEYAGLSEWIMLPGDVYEIAFAPAGASFEEAVVVPAEASLAAGTWNTVVVIGTDSNLVSRVITEDYTPIEDGQSRLTFFHALPDVQSIDVYLDGELAVENLIFPGSQPSADNGATSVMLPAGTHDIVITETGSSAPLVELNEARLTTGNHYFIGVVLDNSDEPDYYLQVVTQQAVLEGTQ